MITPRARAVPCQRSLMGINTAGDAAQVGSLCVSYRIVCATRTFVRSNSSNTRTWCAAN